MRKKRGIGWIEEEGMANDEIGWNRKGGIEKERMEWD